jgi:hypothetical protein
MQAVLPLYDAEIQLAADNGDDEVYTQMRGLRTAVAIDLQSRGATR